jgi:ArsR family transcriptional regulator
MTPHAHPTAPGDALSALGDPTRRAILEFLARPVPNVCTREDAVCACDLETHLGLSQPTVSHHMKALKAAGLVRAEKRGRWVHYTLDRQALQAIATWFSDLAQAVPREIVHAGLQWGDAHDA